MKIKDFHYITHLWGVNGLKTDDAPLLHKTDYSKLVIIKWMLYRVLIFPHIPIYLKRKFRCRGLDARYYADLKTDCQICDEGRKLSFLCPNGTVFQQGALICDWWYKVNCTSSPTLYEESALQRETARRKSNRRNNSGTKQAVLPLHPLQSTGASPDSS